MKFENAGINKPKSADVPSQNGDVGQIAAPSSETDAAAEETVSDLAAALQALEESFVGTTNEYEYEKRYILPNNEVLKERLEKTQEVVKDFKKLHPAVLSFTLYGSMIKGTAKESSDIDGTLLVDTTPTGDEEYDRKVADSVSSGGLLESFKTELGNRLGMTQEQLGKDIKLEVLNEEKILHAAQNYLIANAIYKEELNILYQDEKHLTKNGDDETDYLETKNEPISPSLPPGIDQMFNLDVGGGVKKFRQMFLDSLEEFTPDEANDICRSISAYLSFSEEGKRDGYIKLPQTFEDFKRKYSRAT